MTCETSSLRSILQRVRPAYAMWSQIKSEVLGLCQELAKVFWHDQEVQKCPTRSFLTLEQSRKAIGNCDTPTM